MIRSDHPGRFVSQESMNQRRLIWLLAVVMVGAGLAYWLTRHETPSPQPPLATIDAASLATLRADFNAAGDHARVVVLLSPT
jgi:hypothetical protein